VRWHFLIAIPFKLANDAAQFVGPYFLNRLLATVATGGSPVVGYACAAAMLMGMLLGTLCDNQHFQRVMRAGDPPRPPSARGLGCSVSWLVFILMALPSHRFDVCALW
jgi:hypothetical protein